MFRALTLAALVAYASAQSLSAQCTAALSNVATNPDAAQCLSTSALVPIIAGGASTSIVAPINNWLTSLCGAPACSNATIAAVTKNVTEGCSTELSITGFTADLLPSITALVQQYYPTVRKVVCLKDGNTNCITQTLTNLEGVVGPLTLTNIIAMVGNPPTNISSTVLCTNCIKEAYNVISKDIPSIVSDAAPALQSQCGAAFTDGTTPAGILQSASTAAPSTASTGAALGALSHGVVAALGVSGLVVVSTLFTFLA
ncbi:hypothetical protein B0H34DRAFT_796032 [Crassisporium funariophilum]|nr:hypothetical protein B0H34DRAFT_796032 [Crassisporium funariophilum]